MKKYLSILIVLFFVACQTVKKPAGKDVIIVSILPQKYFIERIAGDVVDVSVLIPPGASPATYSLLPSQLKEIANSEAWFTMKHIGFELSWTDKIMATNEEMKVFNLSEGIDLIAAEEHVHDDHVHFSGVDPHFWMAPQEIQIIAKNTLDALIKMYPEQKKIFTENYEQLKSEVDEVDQYISQVLSGVNQKSFLVFHPALTYFARQYGLEQLAIENMGKEPSPKHMQEVLQFAKENDIKFIFIQKEFDRANAQIIADEIDGSVIQINPLNYDWVAQMKETTTNLKNALQ